MYSEFWNLTKPPFDNVPDASMYVDCHESMENVIAETIYAIKEGNECLTVIVGEVGLGKTLSLRVIIDSLEPEKYKVALITNPALSFVQLLREIIGQITGKQCEVKNKVDLQEMFNRLLFQTADQGKKIVIVIDEANVLSLTNLDDLRLLTNMQDDERNLFTLLLVGQMEFAKTLEHPKRANLFQRIGTYGHLEKLPSEESVRSYIEARLRLAGTQRKIFDDDAIPVIWEFSEHGIPRLINKICKLCLKAGETNEFETISGEVAVQIADRFQKLSKTSLPKRQMQSAAATEPSETSSQEADAGKLPKAPKIAMPKRETPSPKVPERPIPPQMEETAPVMPRMMTPEEPPARPAPTQTEESAPLRTRPLMPEQPPVRRPVHPQIDEPAPVRPRMMTPEEPPARPAPTQTEESAPLRTRPLMPEQPPVRRPVHPQMEDLTPQMEEPAPVRPRMMTPEEAPARPAPTQTEESAPLRTRPLMPEQPPVRRPVHPQMEEPAPQMEEPAPVRPRMMTPEEPALARPAPTQMDEPAPVRPRVLSPEGQPARPTPAPMEEQIPVRPRTVPLAKPSGNFVPIQQGSPVARTSENNIPVSEQERYTEEVHDEPLSHQQEEDFEDVVIGKQNIKLAIPSHIIRQAQMTSPENKNKLAGYWSAQILKGNPNIMHASMSDPVALWFEVKNIILQKFNNPSNTSSAATSL
jgi:type II secretory pathway predicted ATPase ExeA